RIIYTGSKQVLSSFIVNKKKAFRQVVLVEYPRKGIRSLAFITGDIIVKKTGRNDKKLITVFLPSTPNPTTGFLLLLPRKDIIVLDMTIESAIKLIISGGVLSKEIKIHGSKRDIQKKY
ncbi:MAG: DUF502 domain-containing protein, partial [Spirochaetes bacterium]|nr:DUF502 domain-containing protein [Spirochaetota bacterium]